MTAMAVCLAARLRQRRSGARFPDWWAADGKLMVRFIESFGIGWTWSETSRRASFLKGRERSSPRKSEESGTRYIHYEKETARLKVIMPTGGCRVPTCNFCMLPYLARSKSDVEETMAAIAATSAGTRASAHHLHRWILLRPRELNPTSD